MRSSPRTEPGYCTTGMYCTYVFVSSKMTKRMVKSKKNGCQDQDDVYTHRPAASSFNFGGGGAAGHKPEFHNIIIIYYYVAK